MTTLSRGLFIKLGSHLHGNTTKKGDKLGPKKPLHHICVCFLFQSAITLNIGSASDSTDCALWWSAFSVVFNWLKRFHLQVYLFIVFIDLNCRTGEREVRGKQTSKYWRGDWRSEIMQLASIYLRCYINVLINLLLSFILKWSSPNTVI